MSGLRPRAGSKSGVGGFDRRIDVVFVANGYRTPGGVGCWVDDFDGVLSLALAPVAVDETGSDVAVGISSVSQVSFVVASVVIGAPPFSVGLGNVAGQREPWRWLLR